MKKLIIFLSFLITVNTHAQNNLILNGDFENNTALNCMINMPNSLFNSTMQDCISFGIKSELDIQNQQCGYSMPASENWFVSLNTHIHFDSVSQSFNQLESDAFSLRLESNLIPGQKYLVSYYERVDTTFNNSTDSLLFGISSVSTDFGIQIHSSFPVMGPAWGYKSFVFTTPFDGGFLTIKNQGLDTGWTFIDKVQLSFLVSSENDNILDKQNKILLKIVDNLGRIVEERKKNSVLFYIFSDGTVEKRIIIE